MRINSIQSNIYKTQQVTQTCYNPSCKGAKGALKGAGIGGGIIGGISFLAIGLPAALILGGITAGLSAIVGSEFENSGKNNEPK